MKKIGVFVSLGLMSMSLVGLAKPDSTIKNPSLNNTASSAMAEPTKEELKTKIHLLEKRLDVLTQNKDNPKGLEDWFKHIRFAGLLDVDAQSQSYPDFGTKGQKQDDEISLATAKLNIDAILNDWVNGHMGLFYSDTNTRYYLTNSGTTSGLVVDEAYGSIANLEKTPFYLRAGLQYLPFGSYHRFPITQTLTQDLSELRETSAELGFVDQNGLYGAAAVFDGLKRASHTDRTTINNYVASLGYENKNHAAGYRFSAAYLNNMSDVGLISYNIANNYYTRRVGAISLDGYIFSGPFDLGVDVVSALRRFSTTDFSYQVRPGTIRGAQPRAATVQAGYDFHVKNHENKITISYQRSAGARNKNGSSTAVTLPERRLSAGYGIEVLKNTIVAAEIRRDRDYTASHGGTGKYNNAATLRLTLLI